MSAGLCCEKLSGESLIPKAAFIFTSGTIITRMSAALSRPRKPLLTGGNRDYSSRKWSRPIEVRARHDNGLRPTPLHEASHVC